MSDQQMPVMILAWKAVQQNTLRGFASIRLGAALKIHDVAIHRHANGRAWASLPAKPAINVAERTVKANDAGKIIYLPMLEWDNKGAADRFSESVLAALEAAYPDATR